jgi:hypothetical protein
VPPCLRSEKACTYRASRGGEPEQERRGGGAEKLRGPVHHGPDEADVAAEEGPECDGRVDVAAGDVQRGRHDGREGQRVRQRHPRHALVVTTKGARGSLAGEDKDGGGEELGERVAERAGVRRRSQTAHVEAPTSRLPTHDDGSGRWMRWS